MLTQVISGDVLRKIAEQAGKKKLQNRKYGTGSEGTSYSLSFTRPVTKEPECNQLQRDLLPGPAAYKCKKH